METIKSDLTVIGGGPGGYVAAIRAAALGLSTVVVERDRLGGVCLNVGCIPTKALISVARACETARSAAKIGLRIEGTPSIDQAAAAAHAKAVAARMSKGVASLLKSGRVRVIQGTGRLAAAGRVEVGTDAVIESGKVVLATGARPAPLPGAPFDGERIISSTEALFLEKAPGRLVIVGAGAIGMEFAYYYSVAGSAVTAVEALPSILPFSDPEAARLVARIMKRRGVECLAGARVEEVARAGGGVAVRVSAGGEARTIEADMVLVAIGVHPNTDGLWDPSLGIGMQGRFVKVDSHCMTTVPGVYAIGDLSGLPLLAHKASHEGILAAEHAAGRDTEPRDAACQPGVVYCQPQVGQVGMTEAEAAAAGIEVTIGRYPFLASGMAQAAAEPDGFVKLVFSKADGRILGGVVVGAEAAELLSEICLAVSSGLTHRAIHAAVHPHPTFSEAIAEAAAQAAGASIHAG